MIWLASFPRSGNTFFRNVLYEVYGISSSTYHHEPKHYFDTAYHTFPVVKTHLLPSQLPAEYANCKSVYLIRDGRDSMVSIAHHRKDIVEPGSDYYTNLLLATTALNGSYFGGWSKNVAEWTEKADIVIRFKDLIEDPIREVEKLRAIMPLPEPDRSKLPTFKDLKFGSPKYGAGSNSPSTRKGLAKKNFRKGKVATYLAEMPVSVQQLFIDLHGKVLEEHGYTFESLDYSENKALKKVLIEVSKAFTSDNDGVKRYLVELIEHLTVFAALRPDFQIDLFFNNAIQPLHFARGIKKFGADENSSLPSQDHSLDQVRVAGEEMVIRTQNHGYEYYLLALKAFIKKALPVGIYQPLSNFYRNGPFRKILHRISMLVAGYKEKMTWRKKQALLDSYDLIHIPLPQHMHFLDRVQAKYLVTAHDFTHRLFPEYHTENNITLSEEGMSRALAKNASFIAISEATARDLNKMYQVSEDKMQVIYEGANGNFVAPNKSDDTEVLSRYRLAVNDPYFLTLSTIEPRKNIKGTLEAFQLLREKLPEINVKLVIGGKKGWKYDDLPSSEAMLNEQGIYLTGFIPDSDLPVLYRNALALCYVSHYEGFGLPLLEAMQSGTTVIYGNNSSMPEVVGEGGIGVDSRDKAAIADAMKTLIEDASMRQSLVEKARIQAYKFSWQKAAFETMNYYEEVIIKSEE